MGFSLKHFKTGGLMDLFKTCKQKLQKMKADLLNRARQAAADFNQIDKASGDEIDQSSAHQEEHTFLVNQDRIKTQLLEIEYALARIENGTYGTCEVTEEKIEDERLLAIPWTRLSIEGAEIQESAQKRYAN
jgi:DnaK suppressor protein